MSDPPCAPCDLLHPHCREAYVPINPHYLALASSIAVGVGAQVLLKVGASGTPRHALHQGDDLCALRPAARRGGLALSLSRLGGLLAPSLRLRRGLLLALAVVADANRGRACVGDLEPDPLVLLVRQPVRLIALDPDLLQKPELSKPDHCRLEGCGSHALRQDRETVLTLRRRREDNELGVVELTAVRLRHNALRCGSWRQPAATIATPPFASRQRGGRGLFAVKSLASAQPARPGQQRSLRQTKPVLSAGNSKILVVGATVSPGEFSASPSRPTVSTHQRRGLSPVSVPATTAWPSGYVTRS